MIKALIFIVGLALIFAGRELFWLFLGTLGFAAGLEAAKFYPGVLPHGTVYLTAILAGALGVVAAVFFQALALLIAGFVSGAYFTFCIPDIFGYEPLAIYGWVVLLGAIIGAVLALRFFSWALVLSCWWLF